MIAGLIILYCVLGLSSFALQEIFLFRARIFYPALLLALTYYVAAFVLYKSNLASANLSSFLTWWAYFLLIYKAARWQFFKEHQHEPILTKGSARNIATGRKAHLGDYIFTLVVVTVPAALSFMTAALLITLDNPK
jgi:hypothetical protein